MAASAAVIASLGSSAAQESTPSSLSETYEDWTVNCTTRSEKRRCAFSQRQLRQDGQRVLTVELAPLTQGGLQGSLVLPFGLALDKGVTFAVDESARSKPFAFKTCLPIGCVVSTTFSSATVKAFRSGTTLKLGTVASDSGKEVAFSVSLKGFGTALDRTAALAPLQ